MAATKGRRVALWAGAAGLVVLVVAGLALKDRLWEEWWLYRLEHGDQRVRESAARALGSMRSLRSVPRLVRAIQREPREGAARHGREFFLFTPLVAALYAVGPSAFPVVHEQIRTMSASGKRFELVAIAWDTPGCTVREITVHELEDRSVFSPVQIHPEF